MTMVLRTKPLSDVVRGIIKRDNGCWLDASDMSTMYQDAAGTTPVTAMEQPVGLWLDKSGNGNHATQSITASRPVISARKNLLLATDVLATQSVTAVAAQQTLSFTGTGSVTLSGTATGNLTGTGENNRVSLTFTPTAGTLTLTVTGDARLAQLEYGPTATTYQRVNTATDYDTAGFPKYLKFDGVDDAMTISKDFGSDAMLALAVDGNVSIVDDTALANPITLNAGGNLYGVVVIDRNTTPYERKATKLLLGDRYFGTPTRVNDIGIQGDMGYGVGICPNLPAGYTELAGTQFKYDAEYGNYRYSDGSIQCWVPAFYARIGDASNPTYATYGVNSVDTKPVSYFANKAAANAAGYFLPRCFIDGGVIKDGVFVDKYMCSNNAGIASSLKNGNPLSSAVDHNQFAGLTGAPSNTYSGAWAAAKTRGARFFVCSRFIYSALALLSLAHGQAVSDGTNCAWFGKTRTSNFPKGCNNNARRDTNDTAVTYTSDGYSNCGKTGSGVPFAKTTHNGQACGIADLNGLVWEISQGVTCIATSKTITAATQTNPVSLTITGHGMTTGAQVQIQSVAGMTQLNDKIYIATVVDANTITLSGVDGTAFTAYTSGGSATYGTFYVAKESAQMANFTGGNSLSTGHFGSVGVAANMDVFVPVFATTYPNNGFAQKMGYSANQVLSPDLTGNNAVLRSLGAPIAAGMSVSGSNLFGSDYFYQYIRNELCLLSGASWGLGSNAGVWTSLWSGARADSGYGSGFRSASYN